MRRLSDRAGQSLIEFILVLPILLFLVFGVIQQYVIQDRQQRADMALWYMMRGPTYDYVHNPQGYDEVQRDITQTFFGKGDVVDFVANDHPPASAWTGFLDGFGTIYPLDESLTRVWSMTVHFDNPMAKLKLPFAQTGFATPVETGDKLTVGTEGYLWTSWTAIVNKPDVSDQDINNAGNSARPHEGDVKKKFEEAMAHYKKEAEQAYKDWQQKTAEAASDRQKAADAKNDADRKKWNDAADAAEKQAGQDWNEYQNYTNQYNQTKQMCQQFLHATC